MRLLRDKASGPGAANSLLKALRTFGRWAGHNPAAGVERLRYRKEPYRTWTPDDITRYRNRWPHGTNQRLALELLLYTGARRSDVVKLGAKNVRDGWLAFLTSKTGTPVALPLSTELSRILDTGKLEGTFLRTPQGEPYTAAGFGNRFRQWASAAGVEGSAHGLRKASATMLAERGASEAMLRAIFGWSEQSREPGRYTAAARRRQLAKAGYDLISVPENQTGTCKDESPSEIKGGWQEWRSTRPAGSSKG